MNEWVMADSKTWQTAKYGRQQNMADSNIWQTAKPDSVVYFNNTCPLPKHSLIPLIHTCRPGF
jgi:hypothetical protein